MKVPADLPADRLIREYLARVAEAGMHYLPMGRRGAFVEGTRRRIEREIGPDGIGDPARVRDVLSKLGVEITRIVVKELVSDDSGGGIFHGSLYLQMGEKEVEIDCRPSDAIALAVRSDARILVADTVLDRSAILAESEEDHNLTVFKQFIESLPDEPQAPPTN